MGRDATVNPGSVRYTAAVLRLTLRARDDGRFLARIIDRDGFAFVLDYGDPAMVADATERVTRGFSLWRSGRLETVGPASPELLTLLAEFYAQEGLVVTLEEPPPPGSSAPEPLEVGLPLETSSEPPEPSEETELKVLAEEETELVSFSDLPDLGAELETWVGPRKTNPGALQKRTLWRPAGVPEPAPVVPRKRLKVEPVAPPPVVEATPEPAVAASADEEETELVPLDMRRAALGDEDRTELDMGTGDVAYEENT